MLLETSWETHWELDENPLRIEWEHIVNSKNLEPNRLIKVVTRELAWSEIVAHPHW
jgi:hypothetical protein